MGFDPDAHFWVDERVYEHMSLAARGAAPSRSAGPSASGPGARPSRRWPRTGTCAWAGRLRDGWREALPTLRGGREDRHALGRAEGDGGASPSTRPTMIGGAADLVESTKTRVRGRRASSRACTPGATSRSASASTRWARSSTARAAHGGIVKPYGSTFLIFSDYMRGVGAAVGADGAAGRVGVDARLGRPRRGRPDAPAGRALRVAARDPAPVGDPPRPTRTRPRSRGAWRSSARTARSRCCSRARTSRCSTATRSPPAEGSSAAATCCGTSPRGEPELILIATGAEVAPTLDGGADARRRRHARCASSRCRAWSCSKRRPQEYRDRCCRAA